MFYYIEGNVAVIDVGLAVIDCGGVGYALNTADIADAMQGSGLVTASAMEKALQEQLVSHSTMMARIHF